MLKDMTSDYSQAICKAYNVSPFSASGYCSKDNAQAQLQGKTHYTDNDTLRYFKSRILATYDVDHGTLFALIESVSLDMHHTKRGFRFVVFDLCGQVLGRDSLENAYISRKNATAAMWDWINDFDVVGHYQTRMADDIKRSERHTKELRDTLATIGKESI